MEKTPMNYKMIRNIQQHEKTSSLLTKLDPQFFEKSRSYIKTLEQAEATEQNELKLKIINDELKNTQKIITNIYELREKKIVQAALSSIRGAKLELKNLLPAEELLYNAIVDQLQATRQSLFSDQNSSSKEPVTKDFQEKKPTQSNTNPIVRVLQTTPKFVGTDMKTYSLRKDDVVTLPTETCKPLEKRGVVTPVT